MFELVDAQVPHGEMRAFLKSCSKECTGFVKWQG